MNLSQYFRLIVPVFSLIACVNKKAAQDVISDNIKDTPVAVNTSIADTFETGKVIAQVICKTDASQSYALCVPAKENNEVLPVIYFFDPQPDGAGALSRYT